MCVNGVLARVYTQFCYHHNPDQVKMAAEDEWMNERLGV